MSKNLAYTEIKKAIQILVVEDDYMLALNLQEILYSLGYRVISIADCAELALKKAQEFRPDLILMDIQLFGDINGIQAAEKIWDNLQIPSLYFTGYADKAILERSTTNYPFAYIFKPMTKQELDAAIQKLLGKML